MNKRIIIATALTLLMVGCGKKPEEAKQENVELDTLEQKVSYIIGYSTARQVKEQGYELSPEIVRMAIEHINEGHAALLSEEEMYAAMSTFEAEIQEKQQAMFAEVAEKNLAEGKAFLEQNAKREGVVSLESGLQYEVLIEGEGQSPLATDKVTVNYKGMLIDGQVFEEDMEVKFIVNQLIPGWVEALPLMKLGSKWKIYIPSELAYGQGGTQGIAPNTTLIFEMELVSIGKPE